MKSAGGDDGIVLHGIQAHKTIMAIVKWLTLFRMNGAK